MLYGHLHRIDSVYQHGTAHKTQQYLRDLKLVKLQFLTM